MKARLLPFLAGVSLLFVSTDALAAPCRPGEQWVGNRCVQVPKTFQMVPPPKGGIYKGAVKRACPAGWMWSDMKQRCINIGQGGYLGR